MSQEAGERARQPISSFASRADASVPRTANAIPMARAPQPDSQNYVSRPSTGSSTFSVYDGDSHRATTAHSLQYSQQAPHHHLTAHDSYFLDPRHMGHPMGVEGEQRVQLDSSGSGETGSMDEDSTASTREG